MRVRDEASFVPIQKAEKSAENAGKSASDEAPMVYRGSRSAQYNVHP